MKRGLFLVALLCVATLAALGQQESKGLLIYQEPASSQQEAIEYRSIRKDNPLYSTLVSSTGEHKQLKTAGVIGMAEYPPFSFDESFPDAARSMLNKIHALERQFPQLQHQLEMVRGKWDRAVSVYEQTHKPDNAAAQNSRILHDLRLKAGQYSNVRLISANYDSATIAHDGG